MKVHWNAHSCSYQCQDPPGGGISLGKGKLEGREAGAAPALRKWGGQEVKLIARRYFWCFFINTDLRKFGWTCPPQSTPWHRPWRGGEGGRREEGGGDRNGEMKVIVI